MSATLGRGLTVAGGVGPVAGTTPYPWPYDGGCRGTRLALVVAGWDRAWRRRVVGADAAATESSVERLATAVAAAGGTAVTLAHVGPPRLSLGPARAEAGDPTPPALPSATHHVAAGLDGFWGSGLDAALRIAGATHLLVAGHGLEGPVHSTLRGANDRGYECLLVLDAATALDPDLVAPSRSMVEMSGGIFGAVGRAGDVLAALRPVPVNPPSEAHTR